MTVSNTTTETNLFSFSQAAVANTCMYRIRAGGTILNNSGAGVTYLLRFKIGATTIFASVAVTRASDTATRKWTAEWLVNMVGAKTAQVVTGQFLTSSAGSQTWLGIAAGDQLIGTNTSTEDMSTAKTVAFTVQMGTANANANMVLNFFNVEEITE